MNNVTEIATYLKIESSSPPDFIDNNNFNSILKLLKLLIKTAMIKY